MDFRDAFFDEICKIASEDKDVMVLTADMGAFGLDKFKDAFPTRYINLGIAEQNMVNVAAGLALGGKKVFIYAIATFATYRCYEQIKLNLCDMGLPVTIIGAGPGISYGWDGPSHLCLYDIPIMQVLPEMTILSPSNVLEARKAARIGYECPTPVYIRLRKGEIPATYGKYKDCYNDVPFMIRRQNVVDR